MIITVDINLQIFHTYLSISIKVNKGTFLILQIVFLYLGNIRRYYYTSIKYKNFNRSANTRRGVWYDLNKGVNFQK